MKININKTDKCKRAVNVEVSNERIGKKYDEVYERLARIAMIDGFRKGKAPVEVIKEHFKGEAKERVINELINDAFAELLDKHEISPVGQPRISDVSFEEGKPLSFKLDIEVRPELKLKPYKGIVLKKSSEAVTDEEINKAIDSLSQTYAKFEPIAESRPIQINDYVLCDLEVVLEGKIIDSKKDLLFHLSEEFKDKQPTKDLIGKNKDELVKIETVLKDDFPIEHARGKGATLSVLIKQINKKILPSIDDEFAKSLGVQTSQALKDALKKELELSKKNANEKKMQEEVYEFLLKVNAIDLPLSLLEKEAGYIAREELDKHSNAHKHEGKDAGDACEKEIKQKADLAAQDRLKLFFILEKIAQDECIEVTQKDLDQAVELTAKMYNKDPQELRANLEKEDALDDLRIRIRNEKVLTFLIKEAKIANSE